MKEMIIRIGHFVKHPYKHGQIDLSGQSGIGYDLTIKGIDVREGGARLYNLESKFTLKPASCVVLETKEHVNTGNKVFGFICSRASLSSMGFIVSNLKVDPNFSDTLYITAFNAGIQNITLKVGEPFCTIVFAAVEGPCSGKAVRPDCRGAKNRLGDKVKKYLPHILTYVGSVAWGRIKKMDAFAIVLKTEMLDGKVTKAVIYERI